VSSKPGEVQYEVWAVSQRAFKMTDSVYLSDELRRELRVEYWKLADTVAVFDQRMMTVKGWGVTLSLAALAWGFEKDHYGLFLIASLSSAGFWAIEGLFKRHQMRSYVRMRDIEVTLWEAAAEPLPDGAMVSSPLVDWAWKLANDYYAGKKLGVLPKPERYGERGSYKRTWTFGSIALPHVIAFVAGLTLFVLSAIGYLKIKQL
jgi:hypothetical protein